MRKIVKRIAAAASAVVIGGVSCVTTWFSVPAAAAAGFTWLEWFEFQSLLQGIGVGSSNSDFADSVQDWIDGIGGPEIYRSEYDEWMTGYEYYNRLGWDEIIDWFDDTFSGDDSSYSDVADIGTCVSGSPFSGVFFTGSGLVALGSDFSYDFGNGYKFVSSSIDLDHPLVLALCSGTLYLFGYYSDWSYGYSDFSFSTNVKYQSKSSLGYCYIDFNSGFRTFEPLSFYDTYFPLLSSYDSYYHLTWAEFSSMFSSIGLVDIEKSQVRKLLNAGVDWQPGATGSDDFVGPVFSYSAAQDLYKSTGTAAGVRLDVQTQDGVPDLQAALDGAGVDTVDDLVAGVAAGTVPMSKVFSDAKVTPYVVADTTAGTVVTDLGVSATATGVKAVGLTQDLAVPKDLTNAATYVVKGKTWDPEMSKYKLPLFQYFPFCLPWDIYQVLAAFSADPVAPVFDIPVGKILSGVRSADVSKAASLSAKIDFGDDNWSKVFEVIRILECAGIIVGLCLVAVYLIHGGR